MQKRNAFIGIGWIFLVLLINKKLTGKSTKSTAVIKLPQGKLPPFITGMVKSGDAVASEVITNICINMEARKKYFVFLLFIAVMASLESPPYPLGYEQVSISGTTIVSVGRKYNVFAVIGENREGIEGVILSDSRQTCSIDINHV